MRPVCERFPHGGGSVMFWGCVCFNGIGDLVSMDGRMNKANFLYILNEHIFISGDRLIGLQHKIITNFLRDLDVNTLG